MIRILVLTFLATTTVSLKYGSFEAEYLDDLLPVELKPNGKIYLQHTKDDDVGSSDGGSSTQHHAIPSDELIGIWDELHQYFPVTPMTVNQVIQMPSGTYLLPIIKPNDQEQNSVDDGSLSGRLVKFLKVEIIAPDALEWRPRHADRRGKKKKVPVLLLLFSSVLLFSCSLTNCLLFFLDVHQHDVRQNGCNATCHR